MDKPWGKIFVNLLKLIAVPLVFASLVKELLLFLIFQNYQELEENYSDLSYFNNHICDYRFISS